MNQQQLTLYLHDLLNCAQFNDYAPNGLQVEGRCEIEVICTAVTASLDAIDKAIQKNADALLVHHGYFWRGEDPCMTGMKQKRIKSLLTHNMNLFAYHLPLDCHPGLGNNACLANLLGIEAPEMHDVGKTPNLLWSGHFSNGISADDLSDLLADKLQRKPLHVNGNARQIKRIAWCTGGAQDFIDKAVDLNVDAYLSGEISERTFYQAQELGIHYFSCGHHASERYGIMALGEHLSEKFNLKHEFIDSDNPV